MSFTVQDVINEAGTLAAGLAITAPNGLAWTIDAVSQLMSQRTDCMYDDDGVAMEVPALTTSGDTIPLDNRFQTNLARYVASKQFFTDAESAKHREQAIQMLKLSGIGGRV
ncbi:MAG: hypothetical protein WCS52_01935 [bacterium]